MNTKTSEAILISRINYSESDRILNLITPEFGKIAVIAKGSRKIKSKLAGSIELFTLIKITYIDGRNDIGTLISSRILENYEEISKDLDKSQLGFHVLKLTNLNTHDNSDQIYFDLLLKFLKLLNSLNIDLMTLKNWYYAQFLLINGNVPNLNTAEDGTKLDEFKKYDFDFLKMGFVEGDRYTKDHIKYLRLLFNVSISIKVFKIKIDQRLNKDVLDILETMFKSHLSL